jgi:hypothetical protein
MLPPYGFCVYGETQVRVLTSNTNCVLLVESRVRRNPSADVI